jgi:hypothetical protein
LLLESALSFEGNGGTEDLFCHNASDGILGDKLRAGKKEMELDADISASTGQPLLFALVANSKTHSSTQHPAAQQRRTEQQEPILPRRRVGRHRRKKHMAELLRPIIHADFFQDRMLVLSIRLLSLLLAAAQHTQQHYHHGGVSSMQSFLC